MLKSKQILLIFIVILTGVIIYLSITYFFKHRAHIKNQLVFELVDSTFSKILPDKFANLSQVNIYRLIKKSSDTIIYVDLKYVGQVYDYYIRLFFHVPVFMETFMYADEKFLDSLFCTISFRSSYSVFYEKRLPKFEPRSGSMLLVKKKTFYSFFATFFVENKHYISRFSVYKDSLPIYNYVMP